MRFNQVYQSINQCCFAARVPAFFKHALPYRPLQVLGAAAAGMNTGASGRSRERIAGACGLLGVDVDNRGAVLNRDS